MVLQLLRILVRDAYRFDGTILSGGLRGALKTARNRKPGGNQLSSSEKAFIRSELGANA